MSSTCVTSPKESITHLSFPITQSLRLNERLIPVLVYTVNDYANYIFLVKSSVMCTSWCTQMHSDKVCPMTSSESTKLEQSC